jgi:predicted acyl esterase
MAAQYRDIQTVDSESHPYIFEQNVSVPLGNGGVIRCNIYKPKVAAGDMRFPVIITYGPYGKDVPYKEYVTSPAPSIEHH